MDRVVFTVGILVCALAGGFAQTPPCTEPGYTCMNGGDCVLTGGVYMCECTADYWGSRCHLELCGYGLEQQTCGSPCNKTCSDPSPMCISQCVERCECQDGLLWSEHHQTCIYPANCTTVEPCGRYNEVCQHGGTCDVMNERCYCPSGYGGDFCEVKISACQNMNCYNQGTCYNGMCYCASGFTGVSCESPVMNTTACQYNWDCFNNGTCFQGRCSCAPGYSGGNCEIDMSEGDSCQYMGCYNMGTCTEYGHCWCTQNYTGRFCETSLKTNPCSSNPCWNHGTCTMWSMTEIQCTCPEGTYGTFCEYGDTGMDCPQCMDGQCYANHTCKYGCNTMYYGKYCHQQCPYNCRNAMCDADSGICSFGCNEGYFGIHCDETCGCRDQRCDPYTGVCHLVCDHNTTNCNYDDELCDCMSRCQGWECVDEGIASGGGLSTKTSWLILVGITLMMAINPMD